MTDTTKRLDEAIEASKSRQAFANIEGWHQKQCNERVVQAALKFAKAMQPRPIEEAFDGKRVLIMNEGFPSLIAHRNNSHWFEDDGTPLRLYPTHFITLPDKALQKFMEDLG